MGGGGLPCPFFKIWKKVPQFWGKCPGYGHLWVTFLIWNAVFKSFQDKISEIFPCGVFFFVLYMIIYQSALIPRKLPCPKKFLVTRLKTTVSRSPLLVKLKWSCKCLVKITKHELFLRKREWHVSSLAKVWITANCDLITYKNSLVF